MGSRPSTWTAALGWPLGYADRRFHLQRLEYRGAIDKAALDAPRAVASKTMGTTS